jgi:ABC-2 type transport system ATP-binding protein
MSSDSMPVVEARAVTKVFRDFWRRPKVRAVDAISFEVRRGEVFGLLGPNGSGKSTTLKMILGLLHPTRGQLAVLGRSPRDVRAKARVGYLPEESYLYPYLTPDETLDFYGRLFDLNAHERKQRTEQLLEMLGLQHARRRTVGEFSKGMARRIGLAQALINDPDLVVLDEPTSGLDPLGCRQVKDLILTLAQRGKTVLVSSHQLADVEDVCDRVAILYNGRIQAMGSIPSLLEDTHLCRVTFPDLPAEQMQRLLAALREALGTEPGIEHPRRDLEQFFLDVVEKARRAGGESSGAAPTQGVAEYLKPAVPADAALQELLPKTAPKPPAPPPPAAPVADASALREADEKLKQLLKPENKL